MWARDQKGLWAEDNRESRWICVQLVGLELKDIVWQVIKCKELEIGIQGLVAKFRGVGMGIGEGKRSW